MVEGTNRNLGRGHKALRAVSVTAKINGFICLPLGKRKPKTLETQEAQVPYLFLERWGRHVVCTRASQLYIQGKCGEAEWVPPVFTL